MEVGTFCEVLPGDRSSSNKNIFYVGDRNAIHYLILLLGQVHFDPIAAITNNPHLRKIQIFGKVKGDVKVNSAFHNNKIQKKHIGNFIIRLIYT